MDASQGRRCCPRDLHQKIKSGRTAIIEIIYGFTALPWEHVWRHHMQIYSWESSNEFLRTQNKLLRVWWRYIDDTFAVWTHGEPSLRVFIENLNHHHPTIKFTASWSAKRSYLPRHEGLHEGWPNWNRPAHQAHGHTPVSPNG